MRAPLFKVPCQQLRKVKTKGCTWGMAGRKASRSKNARVGRFPSSAQLERAAEKCDTPVISRYVVVSGAQNPLARRRRLDLKKPAGEAWMLTPSDSAWTPVWTFY